MFKQNSSFLVLYTNDINATYDFYNTIGADIKVIEEEKVVVKIDNHEMHFILDSSEPFEEYKYITKNNDYGNGVIFYVEVENIEEFKIKIESSNGSLKSKIFENKWGARELLLEDPNGYKLAVYMMNID